MLFFELIFEDAHLFAVDKPSGIPSHSLQRDLDAGNSQTVEAQALERFPGARLLHRLDTGTSGVLLFAKNDSVYAEMREKFKLKLLKKEYLAWSDAETPLPRVPLTLELPLAHHPKSKKRMIVVEPSTRQSFRGQPYPALTRVHAARRVERDGLRLTELDVEIVTGVTHQIRVHLKHLGFPLLADPVYHRESAERGGYRLGLHARRVSFELRGLRYQIESPAPHTLRVPELRILGLG